VVPSGVRIAQNRNWDAAICRAEREVCVMPGSGRSASVEPDRVDMSSASGDSGARGKGGWDEESRARVGWTPRVVQLVVARPRPGLTVVEADGEIDLAVRDRFDECLQQAAGAVAAGGCLLVDLSNVSFLAACGVRCLVRAEQAVAGRGGQLRLVVTDERTRLPLDLLGVTARVATFASRIQACQ